MLVRLSPSTVLVLVLIEALVAPEYLVLLRLPGTRLLRLAPSLYKLIITELKPWLPPWFHPLLVEDDLWKGNLFLIMLCDSIMMLTIDEVGVHFLTLSSLSLRIKDLGSVGDLRGR